MCNSCFLSFLITNSTPSTLSFHCSPESGDLPYGAISNYHRGSSTDPARLEPRKDDFGDRWISTLETKIRRTETHHFCVTGQFTAGIEGRFRIRAAEGDIATVKFDIEHSSWGDSTGRFVVEETELGRTRYQVIWSGYANKRKSPLGEMVVSVHEREDGKKGAEIPEAGRWQ